MSNFRRKLLIDSGDKFKKVVAVINELPGLKTILRKFDDSLLVWLLTFANQSATSHDLYVFDLNGNILGHIADISSKYHYGGVINNYACIYSGTSNSSVKFDVFQLTENGLSKIRTSDSVKNWVLITFFGYKDNNNNYHMCSVSNSGRNCVFDYNITENTVRRTESSQHYWILWYNYDGQYFRGLLFCGNGFSPNVTPCYVKREDTINTFSSYNFSPVVPESIGSYGEVFFIPVFDYTMNYSDLPYEIYYMRNSSVAEVHNILGLDTIDPTNLSIGNITLIHNNNIYKPMYYGMLSYIKNGEFHAYSYNQSTGLIELMI